MKTEAAVEEVVAGAEPVAEREATAALWLAEEAEAAVEDVEALEF